MDIHFSSPRPDLIVSDAGFSVELIITDMWLADIYYREQDRTLIFSSEILPTKSIISMCIYERKPYDPLYEGAGLAKEERNRIIENIELAFATHASFVRRTQCEKRKALKKIQRKVL